MTPIPDRRRLLLVNAGRAVERFRFRAGVSAHCAYDCVIVSYLTLDDGGQTFHFLTVNDSGPPSSDLAGLRLLVSDARGTRHAAKTNERGEAAVNGLVLGTEYTVGIEEPVAEARRLEFRESVREDLGLAMSAATAQDTVQEFGPVGAMRRVSLRKDEAGDVTASVAVTLPHPGWGAARLALVKIESSSAPAQEWVVGLTESPEDAAEGFGTLTLGQLPPALLADGCHVTVSPVTASGLLLERDRPAVIALLRRSIEATAHDESRATLEQALRGLNEPEPPKVEAPPEPQMQTQLAGLSDQLAQLRSLFQKKIAQDEQSKQVITTLHARLKAAEEDLVLKILKPVLLKMIDWYDTLARHAATNPLADDLMKDLEATLYTLGVEKFETTEERFNPKEQKAKPVENDDPARTGVIVERLRPGFRYDGTLILRPEYVSAYKAPVGR